MVTLYFTLLDSFVWVYIKGIVYKIPVTSSDEMKLRTVAVIESYIANAQEHHCWKLNTCLDILHATKGMHTEVV